MACPSVLPIPQLAGYAEELDRTEQDVAQLEAKLQRHPNNQELRIRLAYRLFHRASLTGRMEPFQALETAIHQNIQQFGPKEDLCLLKANLDFRFHRLAETQRDLEMCPLLPGRFDARVLLADIKFQQGQYEEARLDFEALIQENRTWDNLARLAHWKSKLGDPAEADRLYEEAEDDLTAKQMRAYAWLELQRGVLALTHGHYAHAWKHYRRAQASYPGHWHTDEHIAELLAAEGRFEEAEAMFQSVLAHTLKPELQQALAELYLFTGQAAKAQPLLDTAEAAYLASVKLGGVHYFHHLADFYTDVRHNPLEAVRWARKDLELRSNFSTQSALAQALHCNGETSEALQYIKLALASGVQDARIFSIAAAIFESAEKTSEAQNYSKVALRINPRHADFHMHH
jgi:tetratricopeptide (TPR) repeat protein